jgi:hypothetical protein
MSLARFGFEDDSLYTFQNNYFYTIGIITFGLTLINSSIIYLIGTHYLTLVKNNYERYIFAFALIYVSFLLGFLSVFIIPTGGLTYFLSNLLNESIIKKMKNIEVLSEKINQNDDIKNDDIKNDDISEDIKNADINDISDTSDEEIITNDFIKNEETSDEENGQNCRGCGCFEGLEIPDENKENNKEDENEDENEDKNEDKNENKENNKEDENEDENEDKNENKENNKEHENENKECSNECIEECSKECSKECNEECNKNKRVFNFINSIKEDSIIGAIFKNEIYQNQILNNHLQSFTSILISFLFYWIIFFFYGNNKIYF